MGVLIWAREAAADGGREALERAQRAKRRSRSDADSMRGVHHRQNAPKPIASADAPTPAWALRARRG